MSKDKPTTDVPSALAKELDAIGLSPEYWEAKFRAQGLESKEQIKHIDQSCLKELLSETRHNWEKGALHGLFKDNHKEDMLRQKEELDKLLEKLPDTQKDLTETFQKNAERRKTVFEDNNWVKNFDLDKYNNRLGIGTSGNQIIVRKPLESWDLIRKVSAGQLLRGQFFYKNLQESSTYRQKLIEVDNSIVLMSPGMSETMETLEFNDKNQSDKFDSDMRHSGISSACALYAGIAFHATGSGSNFDLNETKTTSSSQELFVKIDQILNVPMASITLSHQNVYLSPCAMKALLRLYKLFRKNQSDEDYPIIGDLSFYKQEKSDIFDVSCKSFFHEFGSHYYTGVCHLGGRYIWAVTSTSDSRENRSENYKSAQSALNGSIGGGQLWFCGEIKGSKKDENETVNKSRTFSERCKIAKRLEKFGGPQEVDDISLWKRGLAEYNDTWVIIDKEVSQKCYEGVWTLIKEKEFSDAEAFSSKICAVWTKLFEETKNGKGMSWIEPQLFLDCDQTVNNGKVTMSLERNVTKEINELLAIKPAKREMQTKRS